MGLAQHDEIVHALAPDRPDQPFDSIVAVFDSAGKAFDGLTKANASAHETPAPNTHLRIAGRMIASSYLFVALRAVRTSADEA